MNASKKPTWLVATDSSTCRLYEYCEKSHQLNLVKEISHPENRFKDIELTSDRSGSFKVNGGAPGAFAQASDPKEIKIEEFSKEIAKELDHARAINAYEKLIVVSAPHTNGLLLQNLNKHVKALITHNIKKDILHLKNKELLTFIHDHTRLV